MLESKIKNMKYRTTALIIIFVLFTVNLALLFSYNKFYLADHMVDDLVNAKNENYKSLYSIAQKVRGKNLYDTVDYIDYFITRNGGYITLKDNNNKIVYTNMKDSSKVYSSSILIYINNKEYELTYSKISILPGIKIIRGFIVYEVILIFVFVLVLYFYSAKNLLNPMETIIKDINDYRVGKIPFKRKMPKKMEKIQHTFVELVDSLEMEKENQNQIIASISHDIKTPLTSVIGYADRLKNKELTDDKKIKYIDKIYNKSLMMKDILEEFDDYQSCNIKDTMKFKVLTVEEIKNALKDDFEDELLEEGIEFNIIGNFNSKKVKIDFIKIKRVFGNIINNSLRHFNNSKRTINIIFKCINKNLVIEVADSAGGIKNTKNIKRIFEPLFTTDKSRKISGLGLAICKQIITAHDGTISAKNNDIGGLSIIFEIPIC